MPAEPTSMRPGPEVPPGPATMLELGAALGADVWWLEQVFAVAGRWVRTTDEVVVRAHLAELSRVAGDHATTLRAHLPRPAPVDPDGWVVAPSPSAPDLVAALAARTGTAERLAVVHRVVLTRLVVAWARPAGASARGPARAIGHARTDLAALRDEGEALLEALVGGDPALLVGVHEAAATVESSLVAAGGHWPVGPAALPG